MPSAHEVPVPAQLREHALVWLSTPPHDRAAVRPKLASSVLLLRESAQGAEVFMQRRVPSMKFAASMWVFPGGSVDPRDEEPDVPWAGPSPEQWGALLGVAAPVAQAIVIAAVREVFEECGVVLAGPTVDKIVLDAATDEWEADRAALLEHRVAFAEVLQRRGLVLRSDLLAVQDHWITPEMEPRRYDTWFFSALLPDRQIADDRTSEADEAVWRRPAETLQEAAAGTAQLLPPTAVQLRRLAGWADLGPATVSREGLRVVMPEPVSVGGQILLRATLND